MNELSFMRRAALTFAASLAIGSAASIAFADIPYGTTDQCESTTGNCTGSQWAFLMQKTVYCCCFEGNNVWKKCVKVINVYEEIGNPTGRCYRKVSSQNTSTTCIPVQDDPEEPTGGNCSSCTI